MVLLKLFGLIDIVAALLFVLLKYSIGESIVWYVIAFLVVKSLMFLRNFVSYLDLVSSVFLVLAVFNVYTAFTWVAMLWLLQKGFFSILSSS